MGTDMHQDFGDYRGIMLRHFDGDENILGNEILGIDGVYFTSDTNSAPSHVIN